MVEESEDKVHACKNEKEVAALLKDILPKMKKGKLPHEQYKEAFEEAPE